MDRDRALVARGLRGDDGEREPEPEFADLRPDDALAVAARVPLADARDLRALDAREPWALDARLLPALDERDLRVLPLPELLDDPELLARDPFFEAVALDRLLVVDWAMTLL